MSASHTSVIFPGSLFKKAPAEEKDIHCHIVAHRGANNEAPNSLLPKLPENTVPALREAYAKGALYVECDIHLTRDGKIIVLHDDTPRRTARYNPNLAKTLSPADFNEMLDRKITELSYAEQLSQVDVGSYAAYLDKKYSGTKIPLLEEFLHELKEHPQRKLIIELKAGDLAIVKALQLLLSEAKLDKSQVLIISFDYPLIKLSKSRLPEHKHLLLTTNLADKDDFREDPDKPGSYLGFYHRIKNREDLDDSLRLAKQAQLDGLDLEYDSKLINADFIQSLRQNGLMSIVWTYSQDDHLGMVTQMLKAGVDLINTNQPEFVFSHLGKTVEKTATLSLTQ